MRTSHNSLATISTLGIDVGKNTLHLVGLDKRGVIVLQQKVTRHQLARRPTRKRSGTRPATARSITCCTGMAGVS